METPDEQTLYQFIHWNWQPQSTDTKEESLRRFFSTALNDEYSNAKFLFLYGNESTGKLYHLKKIAKETYGDSWESKVYVRMDEGKKFPYKLHAHKVESSKKVVFISNSLQHFRKWKELYPSTLFYEFKGEEYLLRERGTVRIKKDQYEEHRSARNTKLRNDLNEVLNAAVRHHFEECAWRNTQEVINL